MRYRPDIDGLRAVAVMSVVLFHAGMTQFPGGFVGVDIFFVISGFLITSIITREIAHGRFVLIGFYERRIRRIFPALFTVLLFSSIAATLTFLPDDLASFSKSLIAAAFFVSNVYFNNDSDYFSAPPDTKPLLHTWSLAIEEQFYIVFPLILIALAWWGQRRWVVVVLIAALLSFLISVWMTITEPIAAFYLAHSRAWELMLGALLASGALPVVKSQRVRELLALLALALMAWAVLGFSSDTPFPGWRALIPCLGAALLIYTGEGASTTVAKALSWRPMVFVGLISYSLYLWHWPLFVFARYWNLDPLTAVQISAIIAVSFVLATLSWYFIEQPFRRKTLPVPRRFVFAGAATAMAVAVVFGGASALSLGFPARFSPQIAAIAEQTQKLGGDEQLQNCIDRPAGEACDYGASVQPSYAVWGDSHASAMLPAIAQLAKDRGEAVRIVIHEGCRPVIGLNRTKKRPKLMRKEERECREQTEEAIQNLESSPNIKTVILVARWGRDVREADGGGFGPNVAERFLVDASGRVSLDIEERRALFERQLRRTMDRLFAAGKSVAIVYPMPEANFDIPRAVIKLLGTERDPAALSIPLTSFKKQQDVAFSMLDSIGGSGSVLRIYPHRRTCDAERCKVYANGSILYRDEHHLSAAGAAYVQAELEPIFRPRSGSVVTSGVPD